jgi:hypothetical protein
VPHYLSATAQASTPIGARPLASSSDHLGEQTHGLSTGFSANSFSSQAAGNNNEAYRYSADYFAYYYSQRPADTRLPTPLLTWEQYSYVRNLQGSPR